MSSVDEVYEDVEICSLAIIGIDNYFLVGVVVGHGEHATDLCYPALVRTNGDLISITDYTVPCDELHIHGACVIILHCEMPDAFGANLVDLYEAYITGRPQRYPEFSKTMAEVREAIGRLRISKLQGKRGEA